MRDILPLPATSAHDGQSLTAAQAAARVGCSGRFALFPTDQPEELAACTKPRSHRGHLGTAA
jgi:hypothetical protein